MPSHQYPFAGVASRLAAVAGLIGVSLAGALLPARVQAEEINWLDIESRIQYGYYTEDARQVQGVLAGLAAAQPSALQGYYLGLADYRLSLLASASDKGSLKGPVEQCVSHLDQAVESRADFADALALQALCLDKLADLEPWRAPFAASRSGRQMEKARHLAPRNPRVLLLDAIEQYNHPKPSTAQREQALHAFQKATEAFEAERREIEPVPGWGAAEAYVFLARCYLDRGAALQARDALERALLVAPEFAQAKHLMTRITSGS
jgi:tetratricopeptide (TPR) repeat protein